MPCTYTSDTSGPGNWCMVLQTHLLQKQVSL